MGACVTTDSVLFSTRPFVVAAGEETKLDITLPRGVWRKLRFTGPESLREPVDAQITVRDEIREIFSTERLSIKKIPFEWSEKFSMGVYSVELLMDNGLKAVGSLAIKDFTRKREPVEFQLR